MRGLGKQTQVAERGVVGARLGLVGHGHGVHRRAHRVRVGLLVQTRDHLRALTGHQRQRHAPPGRLAVRVADRGISHHGGGHEASQRVVVHHMVDVVVVDLCVHRVDQSTQVLLLELQAIVAPIELDTVHAPVGVRRLTHAVDAGELQARVSIWRPSHDRGGAAAPVARMHLGAIAVLVVVRFGVGQNALHVGGRVAGLHIDQFVVTTEAAHGQGAVHLIAGLVEAGRLALEQDRAGRCAWAVHHALRALEQGHLVVAVRKDIGRWRVHAHAAAPQDLFAIEQDVQARSRHATEQRVAVGATLADHAHAGNGLEQAGAIGGGQGLLRCPGIEADLQGCLHGRRGDHDRFKGGIVGKGGEGIGAGHGQGRGVEGKRFHRNCVSLDRTVACRQILQACKTRHASRHGVRADQAKSGGGAWGGACRRSGTTGRAPCACSGSHGLEERVGG